MNDSNFVTVESVLNIYDNRVWYLIPGFNGYQISNDNYIRSMKHYKKYPFGILLKPKQSSNGVIRYEMSNNNNERVSITLSEILELLKNNQYKNTPIRTNQTDISSHNQSCTIKREPKEKPIINGERLFKGFNINN